MDATLNHIVERLAILTGHPEPDTVNPDTVPTRGVFTRNEMEAFLNSHFYLAESYALDYVLSANGAGAERVYSLLGWWASDATLVTGAGVALTPSESDFVQGSWGFATPQVYPAYISGRTYDVHAAAQELLEAWAAKVKLEHDLGIGDLRLSRSQKAKSLLEMAALQGKKRRILSVRVPTEGTW